MNTCKEPIVQMGPCSQSLNLLASITRKMHFPLLFTYFHAESQGSRKEATIRTGIKLQEKREVVNTRSQKI